jgi:NAD(P)-dependent dehydrogenase (short-subunit alcohol dehydrogenase family)
MPESFLITGATRGLGYSLSRSLLEKGNFVIAVNDKKKSDFSSLAGEYRGHAVELYADVAVESLIKAAAMSLQKITDSIDVLINNAAIHTEPAAHEWKHVDDLSDVSLRKLKSNFAVNSCGPLITVKYFLPFLKKGRRKLIINVSSEAGSISSSCRKDEFAYCMSKAALNMQSKILQNRLSEFAIKVIAVHPGWMKTRMGGSYAPDSPDDAAEKIIELAGRKWNMDDPVYMDAGGNPMNW